MPLFPYWDIRDACGDSGGRRLQVSKSGVSLDTAHMLEFSIQQPSCYERQKDSSIDQSRSSLFVVFFDTTASRSRSKGAWGARVENGEENQRKPQKNCPPRRRKRVLKVKPGSSSRYPESGPTCKQSKDFGVKIGQTRLSTIRTLICG